MDAGSKNKTPESKKLSFFLVEGRTDYLLIGIFFLMLAFLLLSVAVSDSL